MPKKVLLITSVFPPNPGIGGRRWAKFAKEISKEGYKVFVLKPQFLGASKSLWNNDVQNNTNIIVSSFHLVFQKLLSNSTKNIFTKIFWHLFNFSFKKSENYFWDTSSISLNRIRKAAVGIIQKEDISIVIISGNPYYHYVGHLLKLQFADKVKIILDYRDLWNDHSYFKFHFKRTLQQINNSNEIENAALNYCDYLITVDDHLLSVLKKRIINTKVKTIVISNGFDSADYSNLTPSVRDFQEDGKIKLFFAGSIAEDLEYNVKIFLDEFLKLRERNVALFNKIKLEIFCNSNTKIINDLSVKILPSNIIIKPIAISLEEYMNKLNASDYGLLFSSTDYANSFFTKFYDYIYLRKKILNVGCATGDLSAFITNNNIGLSFIDKQYECFFEKLEIDYLDKNTNSINSDFIKQFDVSILKDKIISVINELENTF